MTAARPAWLRAGRVGRPHGLDGSFYVTDPKPRLLEAGRSLMVRGQATRVATRKGTDQRPIIQLDGLTDRDAAEALRGEELLSAREEAPALDEDEWWEEDLEGCTVRAGGQAVGVVRRLVALPSCEALEVERSGSDALLVPLVSAAVRNVDIERREIEVDLDFLGEQGGDGS
jgi:16S rRNA processing protein RimM